MSTLQDRRLARTNSKGHGLVAALDIGSSKITCLIASSGGARAHEFKIEGGGHQQSRGFTGGAITDMEGLERSIRLAVEDAERQAGVQIQNVVLGITGAKLATQLVTAEIELGGREITPKDIRRVAMAALAKADTKGRELLTAWPVAYRVDEQEGVRAPGGMIGEQLSVLLSVVTAPAAIVHNLVACVGRAHLDVAHLVPSAIASGAGTLIDDEIENGAICIDMGAGVSAVSVFLYGSPAWLGLVKTGGAHVTSDIAQGIGTTFAAAERIKTVFATADLTGPGLAERIEVPRLGDDGRLQATRMERAAIAHITAPRIEETFEIIAKRLQQSGVRSVLPRRVVLTGGASQLSGIRDVASRILAMPVRLGRPVMADNLGETLGSPGFSTAAGLLMYPFMGFADVARAGAGSARIAGDLSENVVNRAFHWLKENF